MNTVKVMTRCYHIDIMLMSLLFTSTKNQPLLQKSEAPRSGVLVFICLNWCNYISLISKLTKDHEIWLDVVMSIKVSKSNLQCAAAACIKNPSGVD